MGLMGVFTFPFSGFNVALTCNGFGTSRVKVAFARIAAIQVQSLVASIG